MSADQTEADGGEPNKDTACYWLASADGGYCENLVTDRRRLPQLPTRSESSLQITPRFIGGNSRSPHDRR